MASRATRASEVASNLQMAADDLREIEIPEEAELTAKKKAKIIEEANEIINRVDTMEIDSLAEEMGSWRDNMQGTNLESTNKYQTIDDTASTLENIDKDFPNVENVEEIEDVAQSMEDAASELENCEFPGMFG